MSAPAAVEADARRAAPARAAAADDDRRSPSSPSSLPSDAARSPPLPRARRRPPGDVDDGGLWLVPLLLVRRCRFACG